MVSTGARAVAGNKNLRVIAVFFVELPIMDMRRLSDNCAATCYKLIGTIVTCKILTHILGDA